MITSAQAATVMAAKIPAMCTNWSTKRTPAQLQYCIKLGWNESTGTASTAAHASTSGIGIGLAAVLVVLVLIAIARRSGRRLAPATR